MDTVEEFYAANRQEWRKWLVANHHIKRGVWLIHDKGAARTMIWPDIVQEAICFGWIDGVVGKVSDTQSKIYVSKRKPNSGWSRMNKLHIEELAKNGLIAPAGFEAISTAKSNGAWEKFTRSDNLEYPAELIEFFKNNKQAASNFNVFSDSAKRVIFEWIYSAKRPNTLAKRVEVTVAKAHLNQKSR